MKSSIAVEITELPRPLKIFLFVQLTLSTVAVVVEMFCRFVLHMGVPYWSPLLNGDFPDLVTLVPRFQYFHTLVFFTDTKDNPFMYPAPVAMVYRFFFFFKPHHLAAFFCFIALCFLASTIVLGRSLIRRGLNRGSTFLLLSLSLLAFYPLWFEVKQANVEIVTWALLTLGIWLFLRGRSYSAAAAFGIAGSLKIFPFLYLGLLLSRRQYRQILVGFLVAVGVTVPSLWLLYPHVLESWRLTNLAVAKFRPLMMLVLHYPASSFDHSIFGFIKMCLHPLPPPPVVSVMLTTYLALAVVFVLLVYFLRIHRLPVINQVICLTILSILLPPTSFDYTLINLYAPWALLALYSVTLARQGRESNGLVPAMVCFAILFAAETEVIINHWSYGGPIKTLALIALLTVALRYPFSDTADEKTQFNGAATDFQAATT